MIYQPISLQKRVWAESKDGDKAAAKNVKDTEAERKGQWRRFSARREPESTQKKNSFIKAFRDYLNALLRDPYSAVFFLDCFNILYLKCTGRHNACLHPCLVTGLLYSWLSVCPPASIPSEWFLTLVASEADAKYIKQQPLSNLDLDNLSCNFNPQAARLRVKVQESDH